MPPPDIIRKHFIIRGWELRKKPRCPTCATKREKNMTKIANAPADQPPPSDAAKRARRMVYMALEDYYDEGKKAYKPGYSDKTIAKDTGASEAVVAAIREQDFGPVGPPNEIAEILEAVKALTARLDKLMDANGWKVT